MKLKLGHYPLSGVLDGSSGVQKGETDLQKNKRAGPVMQTPDNPQHVAEEEKPESPVALEFSLGRYEPGSQDSNHHGPPLKRICPIDRAAV